MTLIEEISAERSNYTKTDKQIADCILKNVLEFTLLSISQAADELGISTTSLIRFAKKMGFNGYVGFRKQLQDDEIHKHSSAERFTSLLHGRFITDTEKMKFKEIDSIQQCYEGLNMDAVGKTVELIGSCRNVYCAGRDVAVFLAETFCYRMNSYGYSFHNIDMSKCSYQRQLMFANRNDILFIFDYPKYSSLLLELAFCAKEKGLTVILITDYATCPIVGHAEYVFYCDSQTELFNDSMIAPMFFINLIVSLVMYHNNDKMIAYLKLKEDLLEE